MQGTDPLAGFPPLLRIAGAQYRRRPGWFAVRAPAAGLQPVALVPLRGETVALCRGDAAAPGAAGGERSLGGEILPVYALDPDGPPSVPTGLLLVRFAEGVRAEDRLPALRAAGYEVTRVPPYAPQAAWVRSLAGTALAALAGIDALLRLPDVVAAEPELISERAPRE